MATVITIGSPKNFGARAEIVEPTRSARRPIRHRRPPHGRARIVDHDRRGHRHLGRMRDHRRCDDRLTCRDDAGMRADPRRHHRIIRHDGRGSPPRRISDRRGRRLHRCPARSFERDVVSGAAHSIGMGAVVPGTYRPAKRGSVVPASCIRLTGTRPLGTTNITQRTM